MIPDNNNPAIKLTSKHRKVKLKNVKSLLDANMKFTEMNNDLVLNIKFDRNQVFGLFKYLLEKSFNQYFGDCVYDNPIKELPAHSEDKVPFFRVIKKGKLTRKEIEIMELIKDGLINKQIADVKGRSVGTVKNHLQNIYYKLDAKNRAEALAKYLNDVKKDS